MPGNHKRVRKARAKRAEERRRSSSDHSLSRKSSASGECVSSGAAVGANYETESSAESSPLKCDEEFSSGPFRDYVVPAVGSLELDLQDTIESLKVEAGGSLKLAVGESLTFTGSPLVSNQTSCLRPSDNKCADSKLSAQAEGQDNTCCATPEMGTTSSHVIHSKGGRKSDHMDNSHGKNDSTVSESPSKDQKIKPSVVETQKPATLKEQRRNASKTEASQTILKEISSPQIEKSNTYNIEGGTSVDPPAYEQKEITLQLKAMEVNPPPDTDQSVASLEQAPVMKLNMPVPQPKQIPEWQEVRDAKLQSTDIRPVDKTDAYQEELGEHSVPKFTTAPNAGNVGVGGESRKSEDSQFVSGDLQWKGVFLTEATSDDDTMPQKREISANKPDIQLDPVAIGGASNVNASPKSSPSEDKARQSREVEFEMFGFSVGQPDDSLSTQSNKDEEETNKNDLGLPADISEKRSSLNPEQVDLVTTYIDQLFEACFDTDMSDVNDGTVSYSKDMQACAFSDVNEEVVTSEHIDMVDREKPKSTDILATGMDDFDLHKESGTEHGTEVKASVPLNTLTAEQAAFVESNVQSSSLEEEIEDDKLKSIQEKHVDVDTKPKYSVRDRGQEENIASTLEVKNKETNSTINSSSTAFFDDSNHPWNLPDVVSSSTSVSNTELISEGLLMSPKSHSQSQRCLIYLNHVYHIYKLLEALYNTMCVSFKNNVWSTEPEVTARVILMCKGSRLTGAAIQSLDSLNDQIVQYIFAQNNVDLDLEKDLSPRERETLKSSMVLIRGLLIDAQSKFRKMVDDNRQLAVKIDGSIQAANQEVNVLRAELADTNKRLSQITLTNDLKVDKATQSESENGIRHKSDEENALTKMKEENARLEAQVKSLTREVQELKLVKAASSEQPSYGELKLELIQTRQEVNRAKEALQAMKADRKRLKGEKLDLLNQMKQLYSTLEDKESELRDFIRNYEQRVHESDETIKQLAMEKEECEREKWRIIKKAQEAAERAVVLRTQCDTKDQALKKLEVELAELRMQPDHNKSMLSEGDQTSHSVASTIASEEVPPYETPPQSDVSRDDSFSVKTSTPSHDTRLNSLSTSNKTFNTSHDFPEHESKKKHRIPVFGSLTRMFSKGRLRRSIALPHGETFDDPGHPKLALLNDDNYQEKLLVVNRLKGVHMTDWKANQVLAWLEISLSMSIYGKMCAENIKSGKVLLGLSDSDLGSALGITNSIHRRKLRLAIEEQREPGEIKYSKAASVDHTWVSHLWLPDLGLSQHSAVFESQLADGRLLNQLSKKDLEKYFNVHRKFHQASILHAVELLRLLNFDKELLSERRIQCEDSNTDPLVWTNERVIKWIKSIELGEYVLNLKESGVHGALMVLEPSFTADTLATALGIPPSKSYLRRHIATELEILIKPARAALDTPNNNTKMRINGTGSVGRSFIRSYRSSSLDDGGPKGRLSFRGSLGRAFGRKIKDDLRMNFDSDSTPKSRRGMKISEPIPIQHNHSLDSIVEPDSTPV